MASQAETKVDTVVKVVLVFFVCLLSFSVGTYVGKRFSDYQNKISQLSGKNAQDVKHEPVSLEVSSETVDAHSSNGEAMTSEDVAKLAASLDQAESEVIDVSQEKNKPQERELASTEKNDQTPSEVTKVTPLSQAKQIESQYAGKFTIQIGSFPTEAEAEKLTSELIKKGLSAFYITAKVADKKDESIVKTWYRVNIGLFESAKEAEESKNDLISSKSITNGFVQKIN